MHTPQDRAAGLSVRRRARRQFAALNDGLVSTDCLMLGVGAAQVSPGTTTGRVRSMDPPHRGIEAGVS